jgi:hypothetical protein
VAILHPEPNARQLSLADLEAARTYLSQLSQACAEGATAEDPRITIAALALVAYAGQELNS